MKSILHHPAHLWVSDPNTLEQHATQTLQKMLCEHEACGTCSTCLTVQEKTHPWITWIEPENSYTTDLVDTIINKSTLQLDDREYRFFVLTKTERLTPHSANRLLKTIEEPHKNYFFIFFSQNKETILPTIQSRCLLHVFESKENTHRQQAIIQPFISLVFDKPGEYFKILSSSQIKEQESQELLNILFEHWVQESKKEIIENKKRAEQITRVIVHHLEQPLMPGSSKILWKNIYLTLHNITCSKQ